jgi:hypothetical protein
MLWNELTIMHLDIRKIRAKRGSREETSHAYRM